MIYIVEKSIARGVKNHYRPVGLLFPLARGQAGVMEIAGKPLFQILPAQK